MERNDRRVWGWRWTGGGGVERRNGPGRAWTRGVVGYKPRDSGFSVVVLF